MLRRLLIVLLFVMLIPAQADRLTNTQDIPYIDDGHPRHTLDVYLPATASDTPAPIVFMVHGGGFLFGNKSIMAEAADYMAQQGYGVIVPNYRLAPDYTYPAQIEDTFCALAWTLTHAADYNLDPTRVILLGESAGAHVAALLGTVDDPHRFLSHCPYNLPDTYAPLGVVGYYMPADLSTCECFPAKRMVAAYFGVTIDVILDEDAARELWYEATPLAWLDSDDPPFLLVHGERDAIVPISEAEYFIDFAASVDVQTHFIPIADARHGFLTAAFDSPATQDTLPQVLAIMRGWVNTNR